MRRQDLRQKIGLLDEHGEKKGMVGEILKKNKVFSRDGVSGTLRSVGLFERREGGTPRGGKGISRGGGGKSF